MRVATIRIALLACVVGATTLLSGCAHHHRERMDMHACPMREQQARLDQLVEAMNAAQGAAKADATAAVVEELVRQHKRMHPCMGKACPARTAP
ncbi:MAG: hypothetical protein OEM49_11875 [Myxococcales bacterium]|nr:hypothetical protein [Myxococcales bacterium]MDH5308202.1 hypothetical protein [Myxococcales bacterium]MDH5567801.1 hypothetical protein [Myxococcales bacterium]